MTPAPSDRRRGRVRIFDDATGLGVLESGDDQWSFHCTALVDGSRTVARHTAVEFVIRPAHHGQWEAADIQSMD